MRHFQQLDSGIDVASVLAQLEQNQDLWDTHSERTYKESPHYGVSDIWIRYRPLRELTDTSKFREEHFAEFFEPWNKLPALRPIVFGLMARVQATYLGGILITKIPPGGRVKPHHDRGSWHAETMNCKVYVPLMANEGCVNHCEGESAIMRAGEAWQFDNLKVHSVENNGDTDRITLITCMKVEQ